MSELPLYYASGPFRRALVTDRNTVVCVSADGFIRHEALSLASINLCFDDSGAMDVRGVHYPGPALELIPVDTEGRVYVRQQGQYLHSELNGMIGAHADLRDHSAFRLVPIAAILQVRSLSPPRRCEIALAPAIARIIHQTHSPANPPEVYAASIADLHARNPGWHYRYWGDEAAHDFIRAHFGWQILEQYLRISPRYGAARADFLRYMLIYQFGGVYLDIKSGCKVPFDTVIAPHDRCLLSQWANGSEGPWPGWGIHAELAHIPGGEYQQWHLIAAAGHPFLARTIDLCLANIARYTPALMGTGRIGALRLTGPIAYTLAIQPLIAPDLCRIIDAEAQGLVYRAVSQDYAPERHYSFQDTPLVY